MTSTPPSVAEEKKSGGRVRENSKKSTATRETLGLLLRRCYEGKVSAQEFKAKSLKLNILPIRYLHPDFISDASLAHLGLGSLEIQDFRAGNCSKSIVELWKRKPVFREERGWAFWGTALDAIAERAALAEQVIPEVAPEKCSFAAPATPKSSAAEILPHGPKLITSVTSTPTCLPLTDPTDAPPAVPSGTGPIIAKHEHLQASADVPRIFNFADLAMPEVAVNCSVSVAPAAPSDADFPAALVEASDARGDNTNGQTPAYTDPALSGVAEYSFLGQH